MLGICADHSHHTLAVNNLAVVTHFFTDARTFMPIPLLSRPLLVAVRYPAPIQIVRRKLYQDAVTGENSDEMLSHFARNVGQHLMLIIFKLDTKHGVWQSLQDLCHDFNCLFLRHIL